MCIVLGIDKEMGGSEKEEGRRKNDWWRKEMEEMDEMDEMDRQERDVKEERLTICTARGG
jgi:hypothetical protein